MPVAPLPACTPATLAALIPCLECVSEKKLYAFDVVSLAELNGQAVNAATLRQNASCLTCYSDADLKRMETALFCASAQNKGDRPACSTQSLSDDAKCLDCLSEHDLRAIRLLLLCQLLHLF